MIFLIGLGNPGKEFKKTRHNLGFLFLNRVKKEGNFSPWKTSQKYKALLSEGFLLRKKIILVKPQTFMNNSGQTINLLKKEKKLTKENLVLFYDDISLPLGKIRISKKGGSGGHKGVQSVIDALEAREFLRIRMGIKPKEKKDIIIKEFVLGKLEEEERKALKQLFQTALLALKTILSEGAEEAMRKFN